MHGRRTGFHARTCIHARAQQHRDARAKHDILRGVPPHSPGRRADARARRRAHALRPLLREPAGGAPPRGAHRAGARERAAARRRPARCLGLGPSHVVRPGSLGGWGC